jgi:hypothetical protein
MASHIISLVDTNGSTNGVSLGDARPERKTVYLVTGASRGQLTNRYFPSTITQPLTQLLTQALAKVS